MPDFARQREQMVAAQLKARGIRDPAVLDAFRRVPRETFVESALARAAYADRPLPIGAGQTISQPYIVALMIEAAGIGPDDRVLEVGAGSGYAAAVLGLVAGEVIAIERHGALVVQAADRMAQLGYANVRIVQGDGIHGWHERAPYDAILAAASGGHVPPALIEQLKPGGRLVMPLGGPWTAQTLVKLTKRGDGSVARVPLCAVRFVPFVGAE